MTASMLAPVPSRPTESQRSRRSEGPGRSENIGKKRLTLSLSDGTTRQIAKLRDLTDADSDSEAVRNAVRIHLTLLNAHLDGKMFLIEDQNTGKMTQVTLFSDAE